MCLLFSQGLAILQLLNSSRISSLLTLNLNTKIITKDGSSMTQFLNSLDRGLDCIWNRILSQLKENQELIKTLALMK